MKTSKSKTTIKLKFFVALWISCFFLAIQPSIYAQASLAAENMVEDITVTTKHGEKRTYSLYRDAQVPEQWYYMPNRIRVAEKMVDGKEKPKMTILRYQYQNDKGELQEGGILSATFTMGMEPEVVDDVKNQLLTQVRKLQNSKNAYWKKYQRKMGKAEIRLAGLPLESSTIEFLNADGEFIGGTADQPSFSGATTASQEMVVSYKLTALGASIIKALATGQSGLTMRASISYKGLTPPCGYTIKGKWDNVYKYYEKQTKTEGGFKLGPFKASATNTYQKKRESLEKIEDIEVKQIACESEGTDSNGDQNFQALLDKIHAQVFSEKLLTQADELAKLQSMYATTDDEELKKKLIDQIAGTQNSFSVGYQRSVKDVQKRQTGEINYDYSKQRIVTRNTAFGGELSFSNYNLSPEELLEEGYVIDVDANADFPSVVIGLPSVNPNFNLRALTIEVSYKNSDGNTHSEARQWTEKAEGWLTPKGEKLGHIQFHLIGEKDKGRIKEPEFDIRLQVISNTPNASFVIEKSTKLTTGERYVDALELLTKQFSVDGSDLDYNRITGISDDLVDTKVKFSKGDISISKSIKPYSINGVYSPPKPLYILCPNDDTPESSTITYITRNGKIERSEPIEIGDNSLYNFEWKSTDN